MKPLRITKYIIILLIAAAVGLVIANAVQTDAEADEFIRQTDEFIKAHEVKHDNDIDDNSICTSSHPVFDRSVSNEQTVRITAEIQEPIDEEFFSQINGNTMTPEEFKTAGVIYWGQWKFTYYSEQVLPGEGLNIPGRWSDGNFVRDENGYLCVASNEIPQGDIVQTPFGEAKVYDWIGDNVTGVCDIYVSW